MLRRPQLSGRSDLSILRIRAITTPSDRIIDLSAGQIRRHSGPLLMVYIIDRNYKNGGTGHDDIIAVAIEFPGKPEQEYLAVQLPEVAGQNYSDVDTDDLSEPETRE